MTVNINGKDEATSDKYDGIYQESERKIILNSHE